MWGGKGGNGGDWVPVGAALFQMMKSNIKQDFDAVKFRAKMVAVVAYRPTF